MGAPPSHEAIDLLEIVRRIAREQEDSAPTSSDFDPSWTTITVGEIQGGTASNILAHGTAASSRRAHRARRHPDAMLAPSSRRVDKAHARRQSSAPNAASRSASSTTPRRSRSCATRTAERLRNQLTGDNAIRVAAYATEAGQFQRQRSPSSAADSVVAHQANEFVAVSEMQRASDHGSDTAELKSHYGNKALGAHAAMPALRIPTA